MAVLWLDALRHRVPQSYLPITPQVPISTTTVTTNIHCTRDHYVEGSIFHHDAGVTFDAHQFAF